MPDSELGTELLDSDLPCWSTERWMMHPYPDSEPEPTAPPSAASLSCIPLIWCTKDSISASSAVPSRSCSASRSPCPAPPSGDGGVKAVTHHDSCQRPGPIVYFAEGRLASMVPCLSSFTVSPPRLTGAGRRRRPRRVRAALDGGGRARRGHGRG